MLRALYFLLAGTVPRFIYLKYALSLILVVVGGKMIANYFYGGKFIPTELALLITAILIGGSIVLSLLRTGGLKPEERARGVADRWVPGSPTQPAPERHRDRAQ